MDRLPLRRETPRFTVPEGCEPVEPRYDLVVIGGGLAGLSAAIQAARLGCRVCLIHNRSVLGGNFSSEVRMQIAGAAAMGRGYERFARETGIVEELGTEARWSRWHHRDVHLEPMPARREGFGKLHPLLGPG